MRYLITVLLLLTRIYAADASLDSAAFVKQNAEKLKDSTHVIQIAFVSDAGPRDEKTRWFHAYTATGYEYTGSIPCSVPNDLVQRFTRKFPTQQTQGRRIPTQPLKAIVRIAPDGVAILEVLSIYFTD
jgi:hypothetical protein